MRYTFLLLLLFLTMPSLAVASETSGTVTSGGDNGYAWSDRAGWVNFGASNGNLNITDAGITGYAWNGHYGWINMAPTNGGVLVAANGALSGYAWGEGLGWINFSGVSISSNGVFQGRATGAGVGTMPFDCTNCSVVTDYRPQNARSTPSIVVTTAADVGGGGGSADAPGHIRAFNVPLVLEPEQSGTLEQAVSNGRNIIVDVPKYTVPSRTTIIVYEEPLVPGLNTALLPEHTDLLNDAFYHVTARDANDNPINSFPNLITITLPIPATIREFSDIGVYRLDEAGGVWNKVSDVVFSADQATAVLRVNRPGTFGIFRILPDFVEPPTPLFVPETLVPQQPLPEVPFAPSPGSAPSPLGPGVVRPPSGTESLDGADEALDGGELLPAQLFDIRLLLDGANVARIVDLVARVTFESFGRVPTPVSMAFSIRDETGRTLWTSVDTVTVETEQVFVKRFFDAPTLAPGRYTLRLTTLYNTDIRDEFQAPFTIAPEGAIGSWIPWLAAGAFIVLASFATTWWFLMRRRKTRKKKGTRAR